jgi:hypothetical protein
VLSPDGEFVEEGECESKGVGGLLFDQRMVVAAVYENPPERDTSRS